MRPICLRPRKDAHLEGEVVVGIRKLSEAQHNCDDQFYNSSGLGAALQVVPAPAQALKGAGDGDRRARVAFEPGPQAVDGPRRRAGPRIPPAVCRADSPRREPGQGGPPRVAGGRAASRRGPPIRSGHEFRPKVKGPTMGERSHCRPVLRRRSRLLVTQEESSVSQTNSMPQCNIDSMITSAPDLTRCRSFRTCVRDPRLIPPRWARRGGRGGRVRRPPRRSGRAGPRSPARARLAARPCRGCGPPRSAARASPARAGRRSG